VKLAFHLRGKMWELTAEYREHVDLTAEEKYLTLCSAKDTASNGKV
jgi:hypothetical protein